MAAFASACCAPALQAQAFYVVSKSQAFVQRSASGAVADPSAPFGFSVQAATNATLTLPAGGTQALAFTGDKDGSFGFDQSFATKAALDAAFPNGTYKLSGTGIATLSYNLTTDTYPTATPQVTGGNWNAGGLLVVDGAAGATINFSTNSTYATAGVAGHMSFDISGLSDQTSLKNEIVTTPAGGLPVTTTPFTSYVIPAGSLTNGRVYEAELDFDTVTTFDLASVSGGAAVALFGKGVRFYIAALPAGQNPPVPATPALANQTSSVGGSVTFNIGPIGPSTIELWRLNGQQINFNNNPHYVFTGSGLTINNLTAADAGSYSVTLVAPGGVVTSNTATLTLSQPTAPTIARQPSAQTINTANTVVFSVAASGVPVPNFQWRRDGNNIQGATTATLVLTGNTGSNAALAGNYTVVVSNSAGAVTSSAAALTVGNSTDPGRLINLSILTPLDVGEMMTMGTAIGGQGTSGTKPLVARAAGPALAQVGVTTFLPDPTMTLNYTTPSPAVVVATNNDWAGDAKLSNAFSAVGAFAYASLNSKDAAILRSDTSALAPGNYTVEVKDTGSGTGTVIAELYDATPSGSFTPNTPRLINVSVSKNISATGSLIAGFYVGGSTSRTVLIRAIGPGLAAVGITSGTLADPQLTLVNANQATVATNDNWGGDPQLTATGSRVGAFAVSNPASKDAMILATLSSGSYTVQMTPVSGTAGGLMIIEVYEVP